MFGSRGGSRWSGGDQIFGLTRHGSHPVEVSTFPDVSEADEQHAEKHGDVGQPSPSQALGRLDGDHVGVCHSVEAARRDVQQSLADLHAIFGGHAVVDELVGSTKHRGPREEERDFDVENDEQQSHGVEPQVKLHKAGTDRRFTAFVHRLLFAGGILRPDKQSEDQREQQEHDSQHREQQKMSHQVRHDNLRNLSRNLLRRITKL